MIRRLAVQSSNIKSLAYQASIQELQVEFSSGTLYSYANVPGEVFLAMLESNSIGSFFAKKIKGAYEYKQLQKSQPPKENHTQETNVGPDIK